MNARRLALIAVGLFLATVVAVLLLTRGGALLPQREQATVLPLSDCDLQQTPCTAELPGGGTVTVGFEPRPVKPMQDFTIRLVADGVGLRAAVISFTGVDMNMGLNRFELEPDGDAFAGGAILPICVRNRMAWEARLRLRTAAGIYEIPFRFDTYKQS